MGLIRSTLSLAFLGLFLLVGFTVPIGERTLFGHLGNIWKSNEAQELVDGVKDSSGPLVDRVKRGVEAGLTDEVTDGVAEKVAEGVAEKVAEGVAEKVAEGVAEKVATPEAGTEGVQGEGGIPKAEGKEPVAVTELPKDADSTQ